MVADAFYPTARRCPRHPPGLLLVPDRLDRLRAWTGEVEPRIAAGGSELRVLGDEAIPGVDGVE